MTDLPEGFKKQMQADLGTAFDEFLRSLQEPSPVSVRYNPKKRKPRGNDPVPWCASGRYLGHRPSFTRDPLFHAGAYYVQEASSMLIEQAVNQSVETSKPLIALDLCAAPGGKSTHLLSLLSSESLVISNEVIRSRASTLIENLEKWGYPNGVVTQNDPADFSAFEDYFDLILVDAPCSGEGLFRKDAQAMEEWSLKNVALCASRQRRIVADVWGSLRPGGVLIYSTCTFNAEENQNNLRRIKESHDCVFERLLVDPDWGVAEVGEEGCIGYQCLPHRVRGEGFFFSVVRKAGEKTSRSPRAKDRLQYPPAPEADILKTWINHPEEYFFFLHGSTARMLPAQHRANFQVLLERLHVLQAGTGLGEVKKNKIVPAPALALSICRNHDQLPGIAVNPEQAMSYLRMEALQLPDQDNVGFRVIEYDGLGLGWVNLLPGRINNLFPTSRRVRMAN